MGCPSSELRGGSTKGQHKKSWKQADDACESIGRQERQERSWFLDDRLTPTNISRAYFGSESNLRGLP